MDARVQDYLDDKLQASADFDTIDSLLETVQTSQSLLQQQLDDARRDHAQSQQASLEHTRALRERAVQFEKTQQEIDGRLSHISNTDASDQAVRTFEQSMEKLRTLDIMSGYIELLLELDQLITDCRGRLARSDEAALQPYYRLQSLSQSLGPLQEVAEGAAPHLVDHVAQQVYSLRHEIQHSYSQDLEKTLKALHWPKAITTIPLALQSDWSRQMGRLIDLQRPELESREMTGSTTQTDPPALIALEVLVQPLEQRFQYHFSGNKPTNRLDKPEYFLNHICDLIDGYQDFLNDSIQPLLLIHFQSTRLSMIPAYIDATCAFITAVLPMLKQKLVSTATQVEEQPNLLSHLVHEVIKFDTTMHESFAYTPSSPTTKWRGLSFHLLDTCGYFEKWLNAERDFALTRYQAIIDTPDAGELDYDSVASSRTKPSKAAVRVNDLLETITDQYRDLSSFSQKLRFLIDIQIAIFDQFHTRLHSSLEAYMTMTSSVARTVHGITKDDQRELQGVKGLDRLCRIFGSADYLERAMRDWSDDVFFLELWAELQTRANTREQISSKLGDLQELRAKTSSAIGNDAYGEVKGALFDETADAYQRLRVRSEGIIVETVTWNIREALRPYTRVNTWASLASASTGTSLTAEIVPTLRLLTEYLNFLSKALGRLPLRRVVRSLCHAIQITVWDQVLLKHSFSTAGAQQVAADIDGICANIGQYIGYEQAQASLRKLFDGVRLLSLPVKDKSSMNDTEDDDAAWDMDQDNADEPQGDMSLWEAEVLIFKDNENARAALEKLGLESLTEQDARQVLERRVETTI